MNALPALRPGSTGGVDPIAYGQVLAESGYFSDARDAAKAAVKVMAGQELGIGPVQAMTGIHIIEGKPTLGANLLATLVKASPKYDYRVVEKTPERCTLAFFEGAEEIGRSQFTIADAERAGVAAKQNWKRYPADMLFARALTSGVRTYCPDVTMGAPAYTPDELGLDDDAPVAETPPPLPPAEPPDDDEPEPAPIPAAYAHAQAYGEPPEGRPPAITLERALDFEDRIRAQGMKVGAVRSMLQAACGFTADEVAEPLEAIRRLTVDDAAKLDALLADLEPARA